MIIKKFYSTKFTRWIQKFKAKPLFFFRGGGGGGEGGGYFTLLAFSWNPYFYTYVMEFLKNPHDRLAEWDRLASGITSVQNTRHGARQEEALSQYDSMTV